MTRYEIKVHCNNEDCDMLNFEAFTLGQLHNTIDYILENKLYGHFVVFIK